MTAKTLAEADCKKLIALLERRLEVIGDAGHRERDPAGHLAALQEVSEEIEGFRAERAASLPVRLDHFLGNASYHKALDWARERLAELEETGAGPSR